jgi:transcriptional regulator with XRE-family HTH domain
MTTLRVVSEEPRGLTETVAARIRMILADRRVKQADLAAAVQMTPAMVSKRLNGKLSMDLDEIELFASVLHVSPVEILTGMRKDPRPDDPDEGSGAPSRARTEDLRIIRSDAWCELAVAS